MLKCIDVGHSIGYLCVFIFYTLAVLNNNVARVLFLDTVYLPVVIKVFPPFLYSQLPATPSHTSTSICCR